MTTSPLLIRRAMIAGPGTALTLVESGYCTSFRNCSTDLYSIHTKL